MDPQHGFRLPLTSMYVFLFFIQYVFLYFFTMLIFGRFLPKSFPTTLELRLQKLYSHLFFLFYSSRAHAISFSAYFCFLPKGQLQLKFMENLHDYFPMSILSFKISVTMTIYLEWSENTLNRKICQTQVKILWLSSADQRKPHRQLVVRC